VTAGSIAIAAVAGTAPSAGVISRAVEEQPSAPGPLTSTNQMQLRRLQEVESPQREEPRDVVRCSRRQLPSQRYSSQVTVREGLEEQSVQPWRNHDWIRRCEVFGERCEHGVNLFPQSSRVVQHLLLNVSLLRGGQQLSGFRLSDEIRMLAPPEESTAVGQIVAPPPGICSP
jgi:hypothetical protein